MTDSTDQDDTAPSTTPTEADLANAPRVETPSDLPDSVVDALTAFPVGVEALLKEMWDAEIRDEETRAAVRKDAYVLMLKSSMGGGISDEYLAHATMNVLGALMALTLAIRVRQMVTVVSVPGTAEVLPEPGNEPAPGEAGYGSLDD